MRVFSALLAVVLAQGCATTRAPDAVLRNSESVRVVMQRPGRFALCHEAPCGRPQTRVNAGDVIAAALVFSTLGTVTGIPISPLGALASTPARTDEKRTALKEHALADPTATVAEVMSRGLAERGFPGVGKELAYSDAAKRERAAGPSLVLHTTRVEGFYNTIERGYRISKYEVEARLVDADGTVHWKGSCSRFQPNTVPAAKTVPELGPALQGLAEACAVELADQLAPAEKAALAAR